MLSQESYTKTYKVTLKTSIVAVGVPHRGNKKRPSRTKHTKQTRMIDSVHLHDGVGHGVPHREPFPSATVHVQRAARGPVQASVPDDHVLGSVHFRRAVRRRQTGLEEKCWTWMIETALEPLFSTDNKKHRRAIFLRGGHFSVL